jgi:hypothetical protein
VLLVSCFRNFKYPDAWLYIFVIFLSRPLLEVRRDLHSQNQHYHDLANKAPRSAGPNDHGPAYPFALSASSTQSLTAAAAAAAHHASSPHHLMDFRHVSTAPSSPLQSAPPRLPFSTTLALTPTSAGPLLVSGGLSAFTHFPVPSPLLPPHLMSQQPTPKGSNGYPTPPTELHSPYHWTQMFPTPYSPVPTHLQPHSPIPFPHSSTLLSPAPSSYPSSTNSSREDLPPAATVSAVSNGLRESESKRR